MHWSRRNLYWEFNWDFFHICQHVVAQEKITNSLVKDLMSWLSRVTTWDAHSQLPLGSGTVLLYYRSLPGLKPLLSNPSGNLWARNKAKVEVLKTAILAAGGRLQK